MSSERFLLAAIRHLHNFDHKVTVDHNGAEIEVLMLVLTMTNYVLFWQYKPGTNSLVGKLRLSTV